MKTTYIVRFNKDPKRVSPDHASLEAAIKWAELQQEAGVQHDFYTVVEVKQVYDSNPNHRYRSDHDGLLHDKK